MMKKGAIFIATFLLLLLPSVIFADVKVAATDKADVVKITFTYTNPDAGEVYLPGSHNGWNPTATKMEKGADGTWTYVLEAKPSDTIQYKFYVDGSWTEDANAPAATDDGFGGNNGLIKVALLLAGSAGGAAAAAPDPNLPAGLNFQVYSRFAVNSYFLTRDLKDKKTSGFEYDNTTILPVAYPKITGEPIKNWDLFVETKVYDGSVKMYQENTMGTDTPDTNPYDGLKNISTALLSPFKYLNGPALQKLKITWKYPLIEVSTSYLSFQRNDHSFIYKTYAKGDVGNGDVEIYNGKDLQKFGDLKLSTVLGTTRMKGGLDFYAWANGSMKDISFELGYAAHNDTFDLFKFNKGFGAMATAGFGIKPVSGLELKTQGVYSFGPANNPTEEVGNQLRDYLAGALNVNYSMDMFGVETSFRYGGDKATTIIGDDGDLKKSNLWASVAPWVKPAGDLLKVGMYSDYKVNNLDSFMAQDYINMFARPYADIKIEGVTINLLANMNLDIIGDKKTETVDGKEVVSYPTSTTRFKLNEVGVRATLNSLGDALRSIVVTGANQFKYKDWDTTDKAYPLDFMQQTLTVETSLNNDANAKILTGVLLRENMDAKRTGDDLAKVIPYGFVAGYNQRLMVDELKKPTFYANFQMDFQGLENTWDTGFHFADDSFRPEFADSLNGGANFTVGLTWDF